MNIVIGNIVALVGSILMVYVGVLKKKKQILYVQTIQICLFVLSNIILGGISGAIINTLCCVRNILCYKNKLGLKEKVIITLLSIVLTVLFNNMSIIGLLPLISTVVYIWFMNTKSVTKFKLLIIFTMIMWFVYDVTIKSYTSAIFDLASVITNSISIYTLIHKNKRRK